MRRLRHDHCGRPEVSLLFNVCSIRFNIRNECSFVELHRLLSLPNAVPSRSSTTASASVIVTSSFCAECMFTSRCAMLLSCTVTARSQSSCSQTWTRIFSPWSKCPISLRTPPTFPSQLLTQTDFIYWMTEFQLGWCRHRKVKHSLVSSCLLPELQATRLMFNNPQPTCILFYSSSDFIRYTVITYNIIQYCLSRFIKHIIAHKLSPLLPQHPSLWLSMNKIDEHIIRSTKQFTW